MTSTGKGEDFVDHGLNPDFNRPYSIFLEQGESLFIQGIGSGGDANGINLTGSDERLNFSEIASLIVPTDGREAPPVKGHLFFSGFLIARDLGERGFNKMTNGRGREELFVRGLLIAEETSVTATHRGKKNRNN
jgi:hypothetical protein